MAPRNAVQPPPAGTSPTGGEPSQEHQTPQRRRQAPQGRNLKAGRPGRLPHRRRRARRRRRGARVEARRPLRQARQTRDDPGIARRPGGEDLKAHAVAREACVPVGQVLAEGDPPTGQVAPQRGPADAQEWPHETNGGPLQDRTRRQDPAQTSRARAARQAQEDCLRLVVRRVGGEDERGAPPLRDAREKTVPDAPRRRLGRFPAPARRARDVGASHRERHAPAPGERPHEPRVGVGRRAAQPVVEVRPRDAPAEPPRHAPAECRQRHRVAPA